MAVLSARWWPKNNPANEGALVRILTQNRTGAMIETYGHRSYWAAWDELEALVSTDEGET